MRYIRQLLTWLPVSPTSSSSHHMIRLLLECVLEVVTLSDEQICLKWWDVHSKSSSRRQWLPCCHSLLPPCLLLLSQLPWEALYGKVHSARSWWSPLANSQRGTEAHSATLEEMDAASKHRSNLGISTSPSWDLKWNHSPEYNTWVFTLWENLTQAHPAKLQSDS